MSEEPNANTPLDCGDSSCRYATSRAGMRTNGGCRCLSGMSSVQRVRVSRYIAELRARVEELEGEVRSAEADIKRHMRTIHLRDRAIEVSDRERDEARARLAAVGEVVKELRASAAEPDTPHVSDAYRRAADLLEAALGGAAGAEVPGDG